MSNNKCVHLNEFIWQVDRKKNQNVGKSTSTDLKLSKQDEQKEKFMLITNDRLDINGSQNLRFFP